MTALGFAHNGLRAPRAMIERLRTFYCEVVGLRVGPRPPFCSRGYWLYAGAHVVRHLTIAPDDGTRACDTPPTSTTPPSAAAAWPSTSAAWPSAASPTRWTKRR